MPASRYLKMKQLRKFLNCFYFYILSELFRINPFEFNFTICLVHEVEPSFKLISIDTQNCQMNEYAFYNFVAKPALTIKSIDLYSLLSYI